MISLFQILFVIGHDDLYNLLGVNKTATVQEIKRAYRRKARDTHPDKNTDVAPEVAAEEFHKVVHAFEILSDETSRRNYDRTGSTGSSRQEQPTMAYYQNFWRRQYTGRSQRRRDRLDVKLAMSRVLQIVSLQQLRTVMIDERTGLLERSLLLCFVTPGAVEDIAHNDMVFPFPFAHVSEDGAIWWDDVLQTAEIRIEERNPLTEFFNIPDPDQLNRSKMPVFFFARRGKALTLENFSRLQTNHYNQWKQWVWKQLEVAVEFINQHPYPVEAFLMNKGFSQCIFSLQPGERTKQTSMLGHQWWFRDQRVDTFDNSPNRNSMTEGMLSQSETTIPY